MAMLIKLQNTHLLQHINIRTVAHMNLTWTCSGYMALCWQYIVHSHKCF